MGPYNPAALRSLGGSAAIHRHANVVNVNGGGFLSGLLGLPAFVEPLSLCDVELICPSIGPHEGCEKFGIASVCGTAMAIPYLSYHATHQAS